MTLASGCHSPGIARNGDETAQEELEAAVTAGLEKVSELLADEGSREVLKLGIALGLQSHDLPTAQTEDAQTFSADVGQANGRAVYTIADLEEQINQFLLTIQSGSVQIDQLRPFRR